MGFENPICDDIQTIPGRSGTFQILDLNTKI